MSLTAAETIADYERELSEFGEEIEIGRQTGTTPNVVFRVTVRARVKGYRPDELIGTVTQGEIRVTALLKDLIERQYPLPVRTTDLLYVRGALSQILSVDNNTGRVGIGQVFVKISAKG